MPTKHTPGPWNMAEGQEGQYRLYDQDHGQIGNLVMNKPADALLIAAAPDLLEACEEVAEWLDLLKQNYPDMAGLIRGCQKAKVATAKAEGV